MNKKTTARERILIEGTNALIKRLGYANAARFISSESIEDVVKRIRSKTSS